jgi:hypothetical protein
MRRYKSNVGGTPSSTSMQKLCEGQYRCFGSGIVIRCGNPSGTTDFPIGQDRSSESCKGPSSVSFNFPSCATSRQASFLHNFSFPKPYRLLNNMAIDDETLSHYLADSPPTIVPLAIKSHFEALTEKEQLYAHYISMYATILFTSLNVSS